MESKTIAQLKQMNKAAGNFFFSAGAKRFFNSRIFPNVYAGKAGWYFITSERFEVSPQYPPRYTVRRIDASGEVHDASEFQQYNTLANALDDAKQLAKS